MRAWLLLWCAVQAGCKLGTEFHCRSTAQCHVGSAQGTCEADGYCSFPDSVCASGRRYGHWSSSSLAGACVVEDGDLGAGEPDLSRLKNLGEACGNGAECSLGICADGVCCDSACSDSCHACNVAGVGGTCSPIAAGAQPMVGHLACGPDSAATCRRDGTCDGQGACHLWPIGVVCAVGQCNSTTNQYTPVAACDGMGACIPSAAITCAPYICKDTQSCYSTCSGSGQCSAGNNCVSASCGLKGIGATCILGSECQSTFCAQSVCCDAACSGSCQSCALPGKLGACTPVPAMQPDPLGGCATGSGLDAVCALGGCDGTGHCRYASSSTVCQSASCNTGNNTETLAANCNGAGACALPNPDTKGCAPYVCGATACKISCVNAGDCIAGDVCTSSSCQAAPPDMAVVPSCATVGSVAFCDDFESASFKAAWGVPSGVTLDSTFAHRGLRSVHSHVGALAAGTNASAQISNKQTIPSLSGSTLWGRAWFYVPVAPATSNRTEIFTVDQASGAANGNFLIITSVDAHLYNDISNVTHTSSSPVPFGQWFCVTWKIVLATSATGSSTVSGTLLPTITPLTNIISQPTPALNEMAFGIAWNTLLNAQPAFDMWIDDVLIDVNPLTCDQ